MPLAARTIIRDRHGGPVRKRRTGTDANRPFETVCLAETAKECDANRDEIRGSIEFFLLLQ